MQKLQRITKDVEADRQDARDTLISRGDVLDLIDRAFAEYDRVMVEDWRNVTDFLAMPWWRRWWFTLTDWRARWQRSA